jgi:hypothetical protein
MNDTYRLTEGLALRQFWLSFGLILLVLVGITFKSIFAGEDASMVYVVVPVAVFAFFYCRRTYTQAQAVAAIHSLSLSKDAILIRDGATEQRIPFDAIELLRIRRSALFGTVSFTLKGSGMSGASFYGYDNMEGLVSGLSSRLPGDRVSGARVHV